MASERWLAYLHLTTQQGSDSLLAYLSLVTTIPMMCLPALFSHSTLFQDTPGLSALAPSQEIKKEQGR